MPRCEACPLQGSKRVYGQVYRADICIVGESPGKEELLVGLPFVGPSGRLLNYMLRRYLNVERKDCAVINAVECEIPQEMKKKVSLYKKVLDCCRDAFVEKLRQISPKVVIVLGEIALRQFKGRNASIKRYRGVYEYNEEFRCHVFYTYHPSVVLRYGGIGSRNNFYWTIFEKDFLALYNILSGRKVSNESKYELFEGDLKDIGSIIAIDCEWEEDTRKLLCFSLSGKGKTYVVTDEVLQDFMYRNRVNVALREKVLVFANRPVDERILKAYGVDTDSALLRVDVFNMANLVDENVKISLENLAEVYLKDERRIKDVVNGRKVKELRRDELYRYNAKDAEVTRKLFSVLLRKLKEDPKVFNYWQRFTLPVEEMLASICREGFPIDIERLNENESFVAERERELEMELLSEIPKKIRKKYEDNLTLTRLQLLRDFLFSKDGLKLKPVIFTDTDLPSVSEDALVYFKDIEWVRKYLEYKKVNKLLTTFFRGLRKNLHPDGRIYPNIVLWATVTGRTACMNPNIQQIPRNMPYVEKLKELFRAPEGWKMGARDLSQSELRIMGWLAKEVRILEALWRGEDLHRLTASLITGKPPEEVTKEERQRAKAVNFGFIYGASAQTFKEYAFREYGLTISDEEAEEFREKFFSFYRAIPVFHRKCERIVDEFKAIRSPLGRLRRFPVIDDINRVYRQAINFPVQSFSSDLTLIGSYLFWEKIKDRDDVRLLWMIHDSVFFMAREEVFDEVMALLKHCLEKESVAYIKAYFRVEVGYPVESEGKVGSSWADLQEYTDAISNV
ncbi:MAG: DNA polymerase [Archaeoglobaceae archaeon]